MSAGAVCYYFLRQGVYLRLFPQFWFWENNSCCNKIELRSYIVATDLLMRLSHHAMRLLGTHEQNQGWQGYRFIFLWIRAQFQML